MATWLAWQKAGRAAWPVGALAAGAGDDVDHLDQFGRNVEPPGVYTRRWTVHRGRGRRPPHRGRRAPRVGAWRPGRSRVPSGVHHEAGQSLEKRRRYAGGDGRLDGRHADCGRGPAGACRHGSDHRSRAGRGGRTAAAPARGAASGGRRTGERRRRSGPNAAGRPARRCSRRSCPTGAGRWRTTPGPA